MRRRLTLLLAVTLAAGLLGAVPATADEGGTYLALGDSVAAGTQQPLPFTNKGYTNRLYRDLRDHYGFSHFVNLACPGYDTAEMLDGDASDGSLCYGSSPVLPPGGTSQLDAAVAYLLGHPGEVELITLTVGANDILACSPDFDLACVGAQLGQIGANLPVILGTLQAVAPGVPIVGMNYYQPNLAFWLVDPGVVPDALALTAFANGVLQDVYDFFGVPVADVATTFRTFKDRGKTPQNVRAVCQLTLMCEKSGRHWVLSDYDPVEAGPQTDIHPSNLGYKKIAATFSDLIADYGLLS